MSRHILGVVLSLALFLTTVIFEVTQMVVIGNCLHLLFLNLFLHSLLFNYSKTKKCLCRRRRK